MLGQLTNIANALSALMGGLTPARAANLDNLDVSVGSRLSTTDAESAAQKILSAANIPLHEMRWRYSGGDASNGYIVDFPNGKWLGLRGQQVNPSDALIAELLSVAPRLFVGGSDMVPTMTSNTAPSPFVISDSSASTTAFRLFNDVLTSYYSVSNHNGTKWIQVDFGLARIVLSLDITPSSATFPLSLKFIGSNDGASWDTLGNFESLSWISNTVKTFVLDKAGLYRYYRIVFTQTSGATSLVDSKFFGDTDGKISVLNLRDSASLADAYVKVAETQS